MASVVAEREIDISKLSLEQLNELKQNTQKELKDMAINLRTLQGGINRYQMAKTAIDDLPREPGAEILIPLTSSLYIPGQIEDPDKLLVELGTGYYVQKDIKGTEEFLARKEKIVQENAESLQSVIRTKQKNLQSLELMMGHRMQQINQNRENFTQEQLQKATVEQGRRIGGSNK
eukprot:CAMPEP_0194561872 /NCGR_PEP_ID=MMETSP0292-20121207/2498_1 /TAXON_ID=39354 /ORGANISM="Heterosigma akashiwo, Strain CCMP2393" /LENGTH=174 /DNA_ID=CAMNT_0039410377 /DNA_START=29 /DNA_END=553 /DNA_ORIENTATION=+